MCWSCQDFKSWICNCTAIFNKAVKCEGLIKAVETSKSLTSQNHSLGPFFKTMLLSITIGNIESWSKIIDNLWVHVEIEIYNMEKWRRGKYVKLNTVRNYVTYSIWCMAGGFNSIHCIKTIVFEWHLHKVSLRCRVRLTMSIMTLNHYCFIMRLW